MVNFSSLLGPTLLEGGQGVPLQARGQALVVLSEVAVVALHNDAEVTVQISSITFSWDERNILYLGLAIYLYGDLAIYAAAIAKSIRDVACTYKPPNMTSPLNISESEVRTKF